MIRLISKALVWLFQRGKSVWKHPQVRRVLKKALRELLELLIDAVLKNMK